MHYKSQGSHLVKRKVKESSIVFFLGVQGISYLSFSHLNDLRSLRLFHMFSVASAVLQLLLRSYRIASISVIHRNSKSYARLGFYSIYARCPRTYDTTPQTGECSVPVHGSLHTSGTVPTIVLMSHTSAEHLSPVVTIQHNGLSAETEEFSAKLRTQCFCSKSTKKINIFTSKSAREIFSCSIAI